MKLALLQIQEERYQKGATIITSKLPVKAWYVYIRKPALADRIMDRSDILDDSNANRIALKEETLRTKKNS